MNKNRKIYDIINDESSVGVIALEIVTAFETKANNDNVDYSFTINRKTGHVSSEAANTFFYFDPDKDTLLDQFKKDMFGEDMSDLQTGSEEEKEFLEDIRQFVVKVCGTISKKYIDKIRDTIRRVVLGNKVDEKTTPLESIEVVTFDVADYSSVPDIAKYLMKIGKVPYSEVDTDKVLMFLQERQEASKMEVQDIVDMEKQVGNPLFKNIIAIELGRKYLNEISLYFYVDYSLSS